MGARESRSGSRSHAKGDALRHREVLLGGASREGCAGGHHRHVRVQVWSLGSAATRAAHRDRRRRRGALLRDAARRRGRRTAGLRNSLQGVGGPESRPEDGEASRSLRCGHFRASPRMGDAELRSAGDVLVVVAGQLAPRPALGVDARDDGVHPGDRGALGRSGARAGEGPRPRGRARSSARNQDGEDAARRRARAARVILELRVPVRDPRDDLRVARFLLA